MLQGTLLPCNMRCNIDRDWLYGPGWRTRGNKLAAALTTHNFFRRVELKTGLLKTPKPTTYSGCPVFHGYGTLYLVNGLN